MDAQRQMSGVWTAGSCFLRTAPVQNELCAFLSSVFSSLQRQKRPHRDSAHLRRIPESSSLRSALASQFEGHGPSSRLVSVLMDSGSVSVIWRLQNRYCFNQAPPVPARGAPPARPRSRGAESWDFSCFRPEYAALGRPRVTLGSCC